MYSYCECAYLEVCESCCGVIGYLFGFLTLLAQYIFIELRGKQGYFDNASRSLKKPIDNKFSF